MHRWKIVLMGLATLLAGLIACPAWADDGSPKQVPVPDIRGMSEDEARRVLAEAGLRMGGVERIAPARLESEFGRSYEAGTVVQQAPPPSIGDQPSWLPLGAPVWLRLAAASAEDATPMPQMAPASALRTTPLPVTTSRPYPTPTTRVPSAAPGRVVPYAPGGVPSRPPPPYALEGGPTAPAPRALIPAPRPYQPGRPIGAAPATTSPALPPVQTSLPAAKRTACYTLSCERKEAGWHVRAVGGAAFYAGHDSGSVGPYAGVDLGYTMCQCVGIDLFYRYAGGTFDRTLPNGLLEDSGNFQHLGAKATFDKTFNDTSRLYWWAGLGVGYYQARGFQVDDDGIAGYGELGLGYMLSNAIRLRLGLNAHVMETVTGRQEANDDESGRLLWTLAPVLSADFDI